MWTKTISEPQCLTKFKSKLDAPVDEMLVCAFVYVCIMYI